MIVQRDRGTPATSRRALPVPAVPPLPPIPSPAASDAEWAAFRAAGQARRLAVALVVRARALTMPPPELLRWDGTPYPDLTADPAFEPWADGGERS